MTEKYYLVVEVNGALAKIHDNMSDDSIMDVNEAVDKLNELTQENKELKEQLKDCEQKIQTIKDVLMNSETVVEQKKLQKPLIYRTVINLIDKKIKEAKENYQNPIYDSKYYRGQYEAFNELKKELQ